MTPHAQIKRLNFMRLTRKERQELTVDKQLEK